MLLMLLLNMLGLNLWRIKKFKTVLYGFIEVGKKTRHKTNKFWVYQGKKFYKSLQKWLEDNDILMFSTRNEGKSVAAERFIRTLKVTVFKRLQLIIVSLILVIWIN